MQYLLMLYAEEAGWLNMTKAQQEQGMAAYKAYTEALNKAGVLKGSNRLRPISDATTVRVENGKSQVLNGPYTDSKEQLGGYYLIDVPDLDAALSWAARCPGAAFLPFQYQPSILREQLERFAIGRLNRTAFNVKRTRARIPLNNPSR